jgi:hypothetical protein
LHTFAIAFALSAGVVPATSAVAIADDTFIWRVVADLDDDDDDGQADSQQAFLPEAGRVDLGAIPARIAGKRLFAFGGAERARIVANGRPLPWGSTVPVGAALQGIEPGWIDVVVQDGAAQSALRVLVVSAGFKDGERRPIDLARNHASLERTPPERVEGDASSRFDDPDAARVTLEWNEGAGAVPRVTVVSYGHDGRQMDALDLPLEHTGCDRPHDVPCFASVPIRFVVDDVDRRHPLVIGRSLRAEVNGAVAIVREGKKLQRIRVGGPRTDAFQKSPSFAAKIRPFVVRFDKGGVPSIGHDDRSAADEVKTELALAGAIWGQCGIALAASDVKVVDPPTSHLVAFGDVGGVGASGGGITLTVEKRPVRVAFTPGMAPVLAAQAFVRALEKEGFTGIVSTNARTQPGARPGADVSVRKQNGELARVEANGPPEDATMTVRVGHIDFADGLDHFTDSDSVAGTLEERTLIKALDDGDPTTIEVIIIPRFSGTGRIGESFIASDFSSVRNVVLLDRAGIRARATSLTLAHEMGHVLLDMPGHPDDYGVDTPTLLMDSDAADGSPFGPRRLTVAECTRAVVQSGPDARVPLLAPVQFAPLALRPFEPRARVSAR